MIPENDDDICDCYKKKEAVAPAEKGTYTDGPWIVKAEFNVMAGKRSVATTGGHSSNRNSERVYKENVANAFLVSASPDLLIAMKELLRDIDRARRRGEIDSRAFEGESAGYRAVLKAQGE